MVDAVKTRRDRLIEALRSKAGEWLKRADIAEMMGTKGLSRGDVVLLHTLAEQGTIEIRQEPANTPGGLRYEYRVSGE